MNNQSLWDHFRTADLETLEAEDKAATALHGGFKPYTLQINTLERSGVCKVCQKPVSVYKRQYRDNRSAKNVQSYYIAPCDCRAETFDPYENATI